MLRLEHLASRISEIHQIFNRIFDSSENNYLAKFKDNGNSMVGIDRCGKIQAFMLIQNHPKGGQEISYLGILPRYQRKGYGEKLLTIAQKNASVLKLTVSPCSDAIRLYKKMGFSEKKSEYVWTASTAPTVSTSAPSTEPTFRNLIYRYLSPTSIKNAR